MDQLNIFVQHTAYEAKKGDVIIDRKRMIVIVVVVVVQFFTYIYECELMLVRTVCCQRRSNQCSVHSPVGPVSPLSLSLSLSLYFSSLTTIIRLFSLLCFHTLLLYTLVHRVYAYVSSTTKTTTTAAGFSSPLLSIRQEENEGGERKRKRGRR
jgi:hypothetical protein